MNDADLLHLVAQRRAPALARLYDRYARRLLALALRMVGNRPDAEDVLQEVFIYIWRRASTYAGDRASVSTWLMLITRSRSLDRIRAKKRLTSSPPRDDEPDLVEIDGTASTGQDDGLCQLLTSERALRVRQAMAELPVAQRQILELSYFRGLTQREIAVETGIPIGTVKSRTLLAIKKLRRELADPDPRLSELDRCA